jgi:hypothetical protein
MRVYGLGKGTVLGILREQDVKMNGQGILEVLELYRAEYP